MRIPVSVSMRVRSSRAPSESRPYSESGRSGSTLRRRIRLTCSETRRRSRVGHSSGGSSLSSARSLLDARCVLPGGAECFGERAALGEGGQPRCSHDRRVAGVGAVVAQQRLERVSALVGSDSGSAAFCQGRAAADLAPGAPRDRGGRKALSPPPVGERVQPAVGRGVGALPGRAHQRGRRGERAEPVQRLVGGGSVQVPRTVNLWRPVTLDELIGDVGQCGVLDHRRRVQHTAHRKPGGGRRCHHRCRPSRVRRYRRTPPPRRHRSPG